MKRIFKIIFIILTGFLFCVSARRTIIQANDEIVFKDKNLEAALHKYYEWDGKFTKEKARELSEKEDSIVIEDAGISDLEGLQYFDNLVHIYLRGNNLKNLKPLAKIKSLFVLEINNNGVKGKEFEKALKDVGRIENLSSLKLDNDDLTSLDFLDVLADHEILNELWLDNNKISDISILEKYNNLDNLGMQNNLITDVKPLEHLDKIFNYPDLGDNCIIDYFPIKHILDIMYDDPGNENGIIRYDYYENPVNIIYNSQTIEFPYYTAYYKYQPYVEAVTILKAIGGSAEYDKNTGTLTCEYNGNKLILKDFSKDYTFNGKKGQMNYEMRRMQYDLAYIPIEDICSILGLGYNVIETRELYYYYTDFYYPPSLIEISSSQARQILESKDYKYEVTSQGIRIIKYSGTETNVVIPSEIDGLPVTCISDYAFIDCEDLTSVEIPGSVTRIGTGLGYGPFENCSKLNKVTIKDGSKDSSIEAFAFNNCSSLTQITIPGNYISLNDSSFEECTGLKEVLWKQGSSSVHKIGKNTFKNCRSLTVINIPEGTKYIGSGAFQDDYSLTSVTIPGTIQVIGKGAFCNCGNLSSISMKRTFQNSYIEDEAFKNCPKLKKLCIPEGYSVIRNNVFEADISLITITLPSTLTAIDYSAFYNCTKLQTVTIPTGSYALILCDSIFDECMSLQSIYIGDNVKFLYDFLWIFDYYIDSIPTVYSYNKDVISSAKESNMKASPPPKGYVNGKSLFGSLRLAGTGKTGAKMTADMDAVAPINAAVSYKWTIGGKTVSTTGSYTIKKSDKGKKLTLTVTGKSGYIGSLSTSITIK